MFCGPLFSQADGLSTGRLGQAPSTPIIPRGVRRSMLDNVPRYDIYKKVPRQHLGWLIWLLSWPDRIKHRNRITRIDMDGIEPPYLLLCNHNAFMDFKVASHATFPHRVNYVVAIDGFIKREWLLRLIGCICTRKFTSDTALVRRLTEVIKNGDIAAIYPEARYSLCGTTAVLPPSIGKLAKLLKVPVVVLMCHGHHVNSPFYHLPDHGVKGTEAELIGLIRPDELKAMTASEVTEKIREAFVYDDFLWQKEKGVAITYKNRAKGLHKVLYQCPHCGTEYRMASDGTELTCTACGKVWTLSEYGELKAADGETEFSHVPDWYEWERANVRSEVRDGTYRFEAEVQVDALPNARGYIDLGEAVLTHDSGGFCLKGHYDGGKVSPAEDYEVRIAVPEIYSCHIEYDYLGKKGDCVDLNTAEDTLYIYPKGRDFSVTKIALATEELYEFYWEKP